MGAARHALANCGARTMLEHSLSRLMCYALKSVALNLNFVRLTFVLLVLSSFSAAAQLPSTPSTNQPWAFMLLDGSSLIDDCPICDRPIIQAPMRGSFRLRLLEQNVLLTRLAVEDICFTAGSRPYVVKGSGTFEFGGEVALRQTMFLELQIDDGISNKVCYFRNVSSAIDRPWPMLDVSLDQTNGTLLQTYHLQLAAAPAREIWFSTRTGFTFVRDQATNRVSPGDLLSSEGRVVKHNSDLSTNLGIMPVVPDLGLDAVDILPGGEIAFSIEQTVFSELRGTLQHGDLLSNKGIILHRNQDLLAAFQPPTAQGDAGLDAVQVLDSGEVLFSIETNVVSEKLHITVHPGDLLSSAGLIVRSNRQLLSLFHPADPTRDYGLDAFYLWPHGEIWFSTEDGFVDQLLGTILPGDLLSDSGYRVMSNMELLTAFAPREAVADFGLDALFVITDTVPPLASPRLTNIDYHGSPRRVGLTWTGVGRVFQLQRADGIPGPFLHVSPLLPDLSFDDTASVTNSSLGLYRLLQW